MSRTYSALIASKPTAQVYLLQRIMRTIANKLRTRLGEEARGPAYIFTESRVGYQMPMGEEA